MQYTRLKDIRLKNYIGKRVFITFMIRDLEIKTQKDGKTEFMNITIQDKDITESGVKIFQLKDYHRDMVQEGFIYNAAIDVQKYEHSKDGYALTVYNISMIGDDTDDFIDWCENREYAASSILKEVDNIESNTYKMIVTAILRGNWERFIVYPAASSMHHSRLGGLCVHTNEILNNAIAIADILEETKQYIGINRDVIRAACILHDIGKLSEFSVDTKTGKTKYSNDAALETHIITSIEVINEAQIRLSLGKYNSSYEQELEIKLLKHCILAHHGKLEYGSPIEPSTIEAYIVSKADSMSAEVYRFKETLNDMDKNSSKTIWNGGKLEIYYKN